MNISRIYVSYGDGSKPKGVKVVLGFHGLTGGMSEAAYTDSYGIALVHHSSTGTADVYVSGKKLGQFQAPGETAVYMS